MIASRDMRRVFRNLILISIDNLRHDAISCENDRPYLRPYGLSGVPNTPTIDRLAREGFRFRSCVSTAPATPPAHASILTGLYPTRHGIRQFWNNQMPGSAKTLFERLTPLGFQSVAAADFDPLFRFLGILRGARIVSGKSDREVLGEFKEAAKSGRACLFRHFADVHFPYGGCGGRSRPYRGTRPMGDYLSLARELGIKIKGSEIRAAIKEKRTAKVCSLVMSEIRKLPDAAQIVMPLYFRGANRFDSLRFEGFMSELGREGLLDDALVVITADHGEARVVLGDGLEDFYHLHHVSEELLRVPLIFWSRDRRIDPGTSDAPVSVTDILPTILALLGSPESPPESSKDLDGQSLVPALAGTSLSHESVCYAECSPEASEPRELLTRCLRFVGDHEVVGPMPKIPSKSFLPTHQTVRAGNYKLVFRPALRASALYDLENDPWERVDLLRFPRFGRLSLAAEHASVAARLGKNLSRIERRASSRGSQSTRLTQARTRELSSLKRQFRDLGYMG